MREFKISILSILLFTHYIANGQSEKNEIQQTLLKYFETIRKKQNDLTLKYIYPQYFEHVSKESTVKFWETAQKDPYKRTAIGVPVISQISNILKIDEQNFALVKFSYPMRIQYVIPDIIKNSGQKNISDFLKVMEASYVSLYGSENVKHDEKQKTFDINVNSQLYAIKNKNEKDWKFLYNEDYIEDILKKILPKKVMSLR